MTTLEEQADDVPCRCRPMTAVWPISSTWASRKTDPAITRTPVRSSSLGAAAEAAFPPGVPTAGWEPELARCGPGIVVLIFDDPWVIRRATWQFEAIIAAQRASGGGSGDHFAPPAATSGCGTRWRSCGDQPRGVRDYYANDPSSTVGPAGMARAELPGHLAGQRGQPGREGAERHRDYHLGFLHAETIARFPEHVHRLSPCSRCRARWRIRTCRRDRADDVPAALAQVRAGLHRLAPAGFPEYFEANYVQLPLGKGDAAVLQPGPVPRRGHQPLHRRPADGQPAADLLGVRPAMESVDRAAMCAAVYPALRA